MARARSARDPAVTGPLPGTSFLARPLGYDLAALGYSNDEFFLAGTARSYTSAPGEAPLPHARRGAPTARSGALQRQRRRRVVQRLGRPRRRTGLGLHAPAPDPRGLRMGGRFGAARRDRRRRPRGDGPLAQGHRREALRIARASWGRILLRHLQPGGSRRARWPAARRARAAPRARDRRVAIRDVPRDLRERGRCRRARVRRLPAPRPRCGRRLARGQPGGRPLPRGGREARQQRAQEPRYRPARSESAATCACRC